MNINCNRLRKIAAGVFVATLLFPAAALGATHCEELAAIKLPDTTITSAQSVAAGAFTAPETADSRGEAMNNLPAFCRVLAHIKPTPDSDIKVEVWMPISGWTGRYEGIGNGGFAGTISYAALAGALRQGSAAAATDTGHTGGGTD